MLKLNAFPRNVHLLLPCHPFSRVVLMYNDGTMYRLDRQRLRIDVQRLGGVEEYYQNLDYAGYARLLSFSRSSEY